MPISKEIDFYIVRVLKYLVVIGFFSRQGQEELLRLGVLSIFSNIRRMKSQDNFIFGNATRN